MQPNTIEIENSKSEFLREQSSDLTQVTGQEKEIQSSNDEETEEAMPKFVRDAQDNFPIIKLNNFLKKMWMNKKLQQIHKFH